MINQPLLDFIKQQLQAGLTKEKISNDLLTNGWTLQDIEEGFKAIVVPTPTVAPPVSPYSGASYIQNTNSIKTTEVHQQTSQPQIEQSTVLKTKNHSNKKLFFIILILLVLVSGTSAYYFKDNLMSLFISKGTTVLKDMPIQIDETQTEQPNDTISTTQLQNPEIIFANKLSSCTNYKITFKHPLTGETLEKEILGIINGKCNYIEQMPNNGKMECKYPESERMAVAQYYKDVTTAESVETSANTNLGSGEKKTTYIINGKVVDNPLQEAMNIGVCVISGY
ncbi:MAG: hypothetical protein NT161_03730 [Candidatus Nomurabacteria bacterium]|nr:hypothetical protein [Candidatus Nomurabacteria bacterium]